MVGLRSVGVRRLYVPRWEQGGRALDPAGPGSAAATQPSLAPCLNPGWLALNAARPCGPLAGHWPAGDQPGHSGEPRYRSEPRGITAPYSGFWGLRRPGGTLCQVSTHLRLS